MTPELQEAGRARQAAHQARHAPISASGGREAGYARLHEPGALDLAHGRILYLEDVHVSFDGYPAIRGLSLDLAPGELRCIIGPNGAGKTTMMDIITGKTRPDRGQVFFGATIDLLRHSEAQIAQLGIGRKFQKPTVFEALSVFENLELALAGPRGTAAALLHRLSGSAADRLDELLQLVQLKDASRRAAGLLSHGQKQWLEIGMLLAQEPRLLLLDEPVAGMTDAETERTAELFLSLAGRHTLMVVEHDMHFIARIAGDRGTVTVLSEGAVLAQGPLAQVQADERVIEVYLGR